MTTGRIWSILWLQRPSSSGDAAPCPSSVGTSTRHSSQSLEALLRGAAGLSKAWIERGPYPAKPVKKSRPGSSPARYPQNHSDHRRTLRVGTGACPHSSRANSDRLEASSIAQTPSPLHQVYHAWSRRGVSVLTPSREPRGLQHEVLGVVLGHGCRIEKETGYCINLR